MGRLWSPGKYIARPDWYDRNPLDQTRSWSSWTQGPHSDVERWTYTVPAGRKAWVELLFTMVQRRMAPTTIGPAAAEIRYTPSGGSYMRLQMAWVYSIDPYAQHLVHIGTSILLKAGDTITAVTSDVSTGGTHAFVLTAKITEFDA